MEWMWALTGFAVGGGSVAAVLIPHHRRRLEEMEEHYTRIVAPAPRRRTGVPRGEGDARVTKGRVRRRRFV